MSEKNVNPARFFSYGGFYTMIGPVTPAQVQQAIIAKHGNPAFLPGLLTTVGDNAALLQAFVQAITQPDTLVGVFQLAQRRATSHQEMLLLVQLEPDGQLLVTLCEAIYNVYQLRPLLVAVP